MLLLPPASVHSQCSVAAGSILQLHNRRWPSGTTLAALPGHPTSCTQTSYSPASSRQRRGEGKDTENGKAEAEVMILEWRRQEQYAEDKRLAKVQKMIGGVSY